jgi:outer membrane lipoprotein carrier protein
MIKVIHIQSVLVAALSLVMATSLFAQNQDDFDPKAKQILDEVSANTKKHKAFKAVFSSLMENKQDGMEISQKGSVTIMGNKYILELDEQKIISDGKLSWTFLAADNEVHINDVSDADDVIKPEEFFTIWEKDFKYQLKGEVTENNIKVHVIHLHPMDPRDKGYHTIKMFIDKEKKQIVKIKVVGKDGTDYTYTITSFQPVSNLTDADFTFQKSKYPGIDVIDMRD